MTRYQHDSRVTRISDTEYLLTTDTPHLWSIRLEGGVWNAYPGREDWVYRDEDISGKADADDVIRALIGEPQR